MKFAFRYGTLLFLKYLTKLFYKHQIDWRTPSDEISWDDCRLLVFLNHTSLFEPVFFGAAPNALLKHIARNLIVPIADKTHQRPVAGTLLKLTVPGFVPITRKRDESWQKFLDQIGDTHLTAIAPEGRMKRRNGLDKDGQPMDVKPGVVDIIKRLDQGKILIIYSGGLHHIQAPGDKMPRLFKRLDVGIEALDVEDYKAAMATGSDNTFRANIMDDLNRRLSTCEASSKSSAA